MSDMPLPNNTIPLTAVHPVAQGLSLPKVGTLIPNRIFVGGITSNTTEEELRTFFSTFGPIRDVKVIYDKSGLSKGSYGFVTFEDQRTAESIIKNEAESLVFKDRKLNIGYAVRKQHIFQKHEIGSALLVAHNTCSLSNGLSLVQLCPHDHSIITMNNPPTMCYPTAVMLPSNMPSHQLCPAASLVTPSDSQHCFHNQHNVGALIAPTANQYHNIIIPRTLPVTPVTPHSPQVPQPPMKQEVTNAEAPADYSRSGGIPMLLPQTICPSFPQAQTASQKSTPCEMNQCQWFVNAPRLHSVCPTALQRSTAFGHPGCAVDSMPSGRGNIYPTTEDKQRSNSEMSPASRLICGHSLIAPTLPQDQIRTFVLPGGVDICGCRLGSCAPIPEKDGKICYSAQYEPAVISSANNTSCGNQCLHRIPQCSSSQVPPSGCKVETEESPSHPSALAHGIPTTAQPTPNNLIQRILQSYCYESKAKSTITGSQSSASSCTNADGGAEHTLQSHDSGPEAEVNNPTRSKTSFAAESMPTTEVSSTSPRSNISGIHSIPSQTSTSRCSAAEPSSNFDSQSRNYQYFDKDALLINPKLFHEHICPQDSQPAGSDFWSDPARVADPFISSRLLGMDLFQTSVTREPFERSEFKVTPILTPGSTTSACGDISKQRHTHPL